jgi:arylsulfatase A-like enzyme
MERGIPAVLVSTSSKPNVVLVLADDLGWGDLGCYGASRIPTPFLDSLAAEGVRFEDAHSASAVCTPSRYSLMTGRYCWRSPLKAGVLGPHGPAIIEPTRATLASVLKNAGYDTAAFGKWHLGLGWQRKDGRILDAFGRTGAADVLWRASDLPGDDGCDIDYSKPFLKGPLELGFDRFFGISGSLDMPPYCFLSQDRTVGVPDIPKAELAPGQRPGLTVEGWADEEVDVEISKEAVRWLEEPRERPFFLYLSTAAPHRPCVPPAFARGRSGAGPRGDAVFLVDWVLGEVLSALDRLGHRENTIVVFTSDNGASLRFPDEGHPDHKPNGLWRGQKADVWEGGHREPLIVQWPDRVPAGRRVGSPACLTDLLPTIAALTGTALPPDAAEDGRDLLPLILGESDEASARAIVHHSNDGSFGIRQGRYKAIFSTGSGGFTDPQGHPVRPPSSQGQLYDLADDPGETRNLWSEEPAIVDHLYGLLQAIAGDHVESGIPV